MNPYYTDKHQKPFIQKLNPVQENLVSDELFDASIGSLKWDDGKSLQYKTNMLHLIDSTSRGYISLMEAWDALRLGYLPEHLKVRESEYSHLV